MSNRFTITDLRKELTRFNATLAELGSDIRFRENGRNGYQAVDEFGMHDGSLQCLRNVGCGTSREVYQYTKERYYQIVNQIQQEKQRQEIEKLRKTVKKLQTK